MSRIVTEPPVQKGRIFTRLGNRLRYGLLLQEILDRISSTLGLVVYPYYLYRESPELPPVGSSRSAGENLTTRRLNRDDMTLVARHASQPRSVASLNEKMRLGCSCFGIFVGDELAGYSWYRTDVLPAAVWGQPLFRLGKGEAYAFDAFVLPEFRGRRLMSHLRKPVYEEIRARGIDTLFSMTLAFNASSRKFKKRAKATRIELRLLVGMKRWRGIDVRLWSFAQAARAPGCVFVARTAGSAPSE